MNHETKDNACEYCQCVDCIVYNCPGQARHCNYPCHQATTKCPDYRQAKEQRKKLRELEEQRDKLRDELYNAVIGSLMELFKEDDDEEDDD